jgi:hypothetical protein
MAKMCHRGFQSAIPPKRCSAARNSAGGDSTAPETTGAKPGRPRGEQGRPDQLFRRGLGQSGSVRFPCAVIYIGN